MRFLKKIAAISICLAIILTMGFNVTPAFAAEGNQFEVTFNEPGPDGQPYLNYSVCIKDAQGNWANPTWSDDGEGRYSFGGLAEGEYVMWALPQTGPYAMSAKTTITIDSNNLLSTINGNPANGNNVINLAASETRLSGTVYLPDGVTPETCANVRVSRVTDQGYNQELFYTMNYVGTYCIGGLETGKYLIQAIIPSDRDYWYSEEFFFEVTSDGTYVNLDGSGLFTKDLFYRNTQIFMNILNPDGSAHNDYTYLMIKNPDRSQYSGESWNYIQSGSLGKAGGLRDGTYYIRSIPFSGPYAASVEHSITIEGGSLVQWDGQDVQGNNSFNIALTIPQITGTVYFTDMQPQPYSFVQLYEIVGDQRLFQYDVHTTTGEFALGGLKPNSTYVLSATSNRGAIYSSDEVTVQTDESGNAVPGVVDLILKEPDFASQVKGTVTAKDGNITTSCTIAVSGSTYNGSFSNNYDNGKYYLNGITDGDYRICAVPGAGDVSNAPSRLRSFSVEGGILTKIDGEPCSPDSLLDLQLSEVTLTGRLAQVDGAPAGNSWVDVFDNAWSYIYSVPSDTNGNFALGGFEPNRQYYISGNGYPSLFGADSLNFATDGQGIPSINDIVITLYKPQLYANIQDKNGNSITENCYFAVAGDSYNSHSTFIDGKLAEWGLGDGSYTIRVIPYGPLASSGATPSAPLAIVIENGVLKTIDGQPAAYCVIDMTLTETQFTVNVTDENGFAVQNAWVFVYEAADQSLSYEVAGTSTDENGVANIGGLEPGKNYTLKVNPPYQSQLQASPDYPVFIDSDGNYDGENPINIVLKKSIPQVSGTVTDKNGNLYSNYTVMATSGMSNYWFNPAESGYTMYGLPDGNYAVCATPEQGDLGNAPSRERKITIEGGILTKIDGESCTADTKLDLQLSEVTLTGTVAETNGVPVNNVQVTVTDESWSVIYCVFTDENGRFSLGGFEPNKHYYVYANSYPNLLGGPETSITTDDLGMPSVGNINITVYRPQLFANIFDKNGNRITDYCNFSVTGDGYGSYSCFIEGKLAAWALNDGSYVIRAIPYGPLASSGATASLPVEIEIENSLLKIINGQPVESNIIDMVLTETQLDVYVSDKNGMPVQNAWVSVYNPEDRPYGYEVLGTSTDENGIAHIGGLAAGKDYVILVHGPYQSQYGFSDDYLININSEGSYTGDNPFSIVLPYASTEKKIILFGFEDPNVSGIIDEDAKTVSVTVPYGTDVKALAPYMQLSDFAHTLPEAGTPQDFTNPVAYTVFAQDGSTQEYTVTVIVEPNPIQADQENRIVTAKVKALIDEASGKAFATIQESLVKNVLNAVGQLAGKKPSDVVFDISGTDNAGSVEIEIPASSFREISGNTKVGSLTLKSAIGSMTINKSALDKMARRIGNNDSCVRLSIEKADVDTYISSLPKLIKNKIKELIGNRPVYDFDIRAGSSKALMFSLSGAEVTLPYTLGPAERQKDIRIIYLNELGLPQIEKDCTYDKAAQTVSFKLK